MTVLADQRGPAASGEGPAGSRYPHGDKLRYLHGPCRCRPCTTAWNIYQQQLKSRHRRGEVWANPNVYRPLLDELIHGWGIGPTAIERHTGVKNYTVKQLHAGGHVSPAVASRLDGITVDDFDDRTLVWSGKAHELLDQLEAAGVARNRIAVQAMGWGSWPQADYPSGQRVSLGIVRKLRAYLAEVTRPRCVDCGGDPLPGGFARCLPCFHATTAPSRSDIARRREAAARKRQERARARGEEAA